jgi:hypothetical protein
VNGFERDLAPNSLPQITTLRLDVVHNGNKKCLVTLANACPNLRELYIQFSHNVDDIDSPDRCQRALRDFVTKCPKLEVIHLNSMSGAEKGFEKILKWAFKDVAGSYLQNLKVLFFDWKIRISKNWICELLKSSENKLAIIIDDQLSVRAPKTAQEYAEFDACPGSKYAFYLRDFPEIKTLFESNAYGEMITFYIK